MADLIESSTGNIIPAYPDASDEMRERPDSIQLGRHWLPDGLAGNRIFYNGKLHLVLFGPNGTGKSMRILVPNLLSIKGKSIVVIDPKGQLAAMTAIYRHENGDDVKVIDPFGALKQIWQDDPLTYHKLLHYGLLESAGFNPLSRLQTGPAFYDDAAVIAEALIKTENNKEQHFPESARGLLTGLIMQERVTRGDAASLENVRMTLTEGEKWEEFLDFDKDGNEVVNQRMSGGLRWAAHEMAKSEHAAIRSLGARFDVDNMNRELQGIRSTADTQTRWLLSDPMRADMRKPGVDLGSLKRGDKPVTIYVILPSRYLETHGVWLRLFVSEALQACLSPGGRDVLLMLDEFAALGHLSIVERLFGVTRDYGIQMWPVFQDLPQLKSLYPHRWETILGMAGVVQSFRAGDFTTAEWLSKRAGSTTDVALSYNESWNTSGKTSSSGGLSHQQIQQPNIRPDRMFEIGDGYMLTWFAGRQRPFPTFAPIYEKVTSYRQRATRNPYYRP